MNAISRLSGDRGVLIRLRRDGLPPLRFLGRLIARREGRAAAAAAWHELGLHGVAAGGYAVEIVACGVAGSARCHAVHVETLDEALSVFETHDPVADFHSGLASTLDFDDPALSPAALAVCAARLRCARHDVERRYRIGVGGFLMDLAGLDS